MRTAPPVSLRVVRTDSVRRSPMPGLMRRRSTTASTVWLRRLSSFISSSSETSSPSTRARRNPSFWSFSSSFLNSPLRPRTTGASTMTRSPSGSESTLWTICSTDWRVMGAPQTWQCGWPMEEKEAEVVVDLCHRADRGARAARDGLLLDGDGGREAVNRVHVGAFELVEELPCVSRERLDVAALPLGVDGVEGERGLAGAGEAGDDRQAVARDHDADILQVVLARAAHCHTVNCHCLKSSARATEENTGRCGNVHLKRVIRAGQATRPNSSEPRILRNVPPAGAFEKAREEASATPSRDRPASPLEERFR